MQQAIDFFDESMALCRLFASMRDIEFEQETRFKGWTVNNILRHLHVWNLAVIKSLDGEECFRQFLHDLMGSEQKDVNFTAVEAAYLDDRSGMELCHEWAELCIIVEKRFAEIDPKSRLKWVGPDMSAISSITARLMETWAHAQAIYDVLGVVRVDTDRIGNIVRLGVNTYGWTFKNRKEEPPGPMPRLHLTAPSGALWHYGDGEDLIEGSATEFCQVVTQCRNIADTDLQVSGAVAKRWMAIAQCFAGPPQDPPPPGFRQPTVK